MPEENELYQENLILSAKLREKINKKLSSGGLFTPSEQGATFEQATDNLLEKQNKLENQIIDLRKEIQQHDNESEILRNEINKEISGRGKTLRESVNRMIKQKCRNEKYVPTASQKCLQVVTAPFRWVANKTTTGFALAGFLTTIPTICGAVGWMLKAALVVKTGGVGGAVMVADSLIQQGGNKQGGNLPPNYQPLPQAQNNYSPLPVENQQNNYKKKKDKKKIKGEIS